MIIYIIHRAVRPGVYATVAEFEEEDERDTCLTALQKTYLKNTYRSAIGTKADRGDHY